MCGWLHKGAGSLRADRSSRAEMGSVSSISSGTVTVVCSPHAPAGDSSDLDLEARGCGVQRVRSLVLDVHRAAL